MLLACAPTRPAGASPGSGDTAPADTAPADDTAPPTDSGLSALLDPLVTYTDRKTVDVDDRAWYAYKLIASREAPGLDEFSVFHGHAAAFGARIDAVHDTLELLTPTVDGGEVDLGTLHVQVVTDGIGAWTLTLDGSDDDRSYDGFLAARGEPDDGDGHLTLYDLSGGPDTLDVTRNYAEERLEIGFAADGTQLAMGHAEPWSGAVAMAGTPKFDWEIDVSGAGRLTAVCEIDGATRVSVRFDDRDDGQACAYTTACCPDADGCQGCVEL